MNSSFTQLFNSSPVAAVLTDFQNKHHSRTERFVHNWQIHPETTVLALLVRSQVLLVYFVLFWGKCDSFACTNSRAILRGFYSGAVIGHDHSPSFRSYGVYHNLFIEHAGFSVILIIYVFILRSFWISNVFLKSLSLSLPLSPLSLPIRAYCTCIYIYMYVCMYICIPTETFTSFFKGKKAIGIYFWSYRYLFSQPNFSTSWADFMWVLIR